MSEVNSVSHSAPKVGFVSLGCPKALTDSELILTQLSAEGYQTCKTFQGADLVIRAPPAPIGDLSSQFSERGGDGVGDGDGHRSVVPQSGNSFRRIRPIELPGRIGRERGAADLLSHP